jgi:Tol biopolymer transport system component
MMAFLQNRLIALHVTRFDWMVGLVVVVLVSAIGLTVLSGDRVGVQIDRFEPSGAAATTTRITLTFNDTMNWDTVIERLRFEPPLTGEYRRSARALGFTPAEPLEPGRRYTVTLLAGGESDAGRQVLRDAVFEFQVRLPRVAYLTPADAVPQNIWIAGPNDPPRQVTFSPTSILNFDVSPDGTRIAFAERTLNGTADIKLLDIATGSVSQLTNCPDSDCTTPVWRPDGSLIAYERVDLNSELSGLGVSPTRIWLIDLTTAPPSERPLFSDNQILGYAPQWSADGQRIALFDNNSRSIIVYSLEDESLTLVPSRSGSDLDLSPDGRRLIFPRLIFDDVAGGARSVLQLADLVEGTVVDLIDAEEQVDDVQPVWHPDGQRIAFARRYTEAQASRTRQIYLLDTETGAVEPLVVEDRYFNGFFSWDPQGRQLAIQRFPERTATGELNSAGRPEIWIYDMDETRLTLIAENAYLPRWVP